MSEEIRLERDGPIATVVLDAPQRLNALNLGMFEGLHRIARELEADGDIRAVIFRGTGGRAFSAGADISEFEAHRSDRRKAKAYAAVSVPALTAVKRLKHPTIAAIEGLCVGGGLGLSACCDFRVCGEGSRFGVPVKRLGLVEAIDEMQPLVEKFGANVAMEILLVGEVFPVMDALRMGLVNRVVPDDQVLAEARRMADSIAEGAPLAARWHKKFIRRLLDPRPVSVEEQVEGYDCYDTEDFQTGYKAFLAKGKPKFVGR